MFVLNFSGQEARESTEESLKNSYDREFFLYAQLNVARISIFKPQILSPAIDKAFPSFISSRDDLTPPKSLLDQPKERKLNRGNFL